MGGASIEGGESRTSLCTRERHQDQKRELVPEPSSGILEDRVGMGLRLRKGPVLQRIWSESDSLPEIPMRR